ncbi:hypothetical protein [Luteolibacter sp. LG18]|uniref:hypothetical protein n=1 Tax=Luteolibacter sp. LG18 TaxID=2819286 RepID=UPI002B2F9670|nr:hypothetical protein llg_06980 [Luteolibacter sp. LG18]BCU79673.1 hypothetical protein llg_43880 [Luteolibacter sp. LG18]
MALTGTPPTAPGTIVPVHTPGAPTAPGSVVGAVGGGSPDAPDQVVPDYTPGIGGPPSPVGVPTYSGTMGGTLTAVSAGWFNAPTSISYEWRTPDVLGSHQSVSGATIDSSAHDGIWYLRETATNAHGSFIAISNAITLPGGGGGEGS